MLDLEPFLQQCRLFDLSQPMATGMPVHPTHVPFCFSMYRRHLDSTYANGASSANDIIYTSGHAGTHIDAIGHFSRDGKLHTGLDARQHQSGPSGLSAFGIETTPPMLRRAVLLDAASARGVEVLEPTQAVTGRDLSEAARQEGVEIRPGDVAFVRTGWARFWHEPSVYVGVGTGTPGPDLDGASWLVQAGASLVGSDTAAFELYPRQGAVHSLLLVEHGIQIVENLNLEELARERIHSFLLFIAPLRIVGGTASPVTPVAVVPAAE